MRSPCAGDALDPSESVRWRRPRPPVMDSGGFKKTVSLDCHGTNTLVDVDGSVSELNFVSVRTIKEGSSSRTLTSTHMAS